MRQALAVACLTLLAGCGNPCVVRNAPEGMRAEVNAECTAQADEFGERIVVRVMPQWVFDAMQAAGAFPDAPDWAPIEGTFAPGPRTRVFLSAETFDSDDPRWRSTLCHEIVESQGREHECQLCQFDECRGRD